MLLLRTLHSLYCLYSSCLQGLIFNQPVPRKMYYNYIPFLFAKSYQDRLDCFNNILSVDLKASEIHKAWSEYLQLVIEPIGWKSIWRISREACESLKISFPCTVIVIVSIPLFYGHLVKMHSLCCSCWRFWFKFIYDDFIYLLFAIMDSTNF